MSSLMIWRNPVGIFWQQRDTWPNQEVTATIMFTDIVGFTALLETYPVRKILHTLNDYFVLLSQIILQYRGGVHKFLGDGLMALFICPTDAVKAGCEIQQAVGQFNAHQAARGVWRFETRLAIDTGEVVLTTVGSSDRQDYTLIGQAVNRAAHLSKQAEPGTVWITSNTFGRLTNKDGFLPRATFPTQSGGNPLTVYEAFCVKECVGLNETM